MGDLTLLLETKVMETEVPFSWEREREKVREGEGESSLKEPGVTCL